jgi:regulatory protein YycI of two-component signal transduction system YycFG
MDWSRAKTLLIIAYTLFNVFLGYRLWSDPVRGSMTLVTLQQVEAAAQALASQGVLLAATVPRRAPAMSLILLRHQEMTESQALALFFEEEGEVRRSEKAGGRVVLENSLESLTRYENGVLLYSRKVRTQDAAQVAQALAREQAQEFWSQRGGLPPGARPDYVAYDEKSDRHIVQYYQEYQGYPIYGGQISVVVGPGGVEAVLFVWFSPAGPSGKPKQVLAATDALLKCLEALGRDTTVEAVTLGYYSEAYNATQWEAPPVWRIRTRTGDTLYVNAYTGDLEGPVSIVP